MKNEQQKCLTEAQPLASWLSQRQLAERLSVSQRTLERMRSDGTGPRFAKAGAKILYNIADVETWLVERSFENTAESKRSGGQR